MKDDIIIRPAPIPEISERLQQVLELISWGYDRVLIASTLVISPLTVKTHVDRLFTALDARDRAHAVAIGYRCGLLGETRPPWRPDVCHAWRRIPDTPPALIPPEHLTISHIGGPWWTITRNGFTLNSTGDWDRTHRHPNTAWAVEHRFTSQAAEVMARLVILRESLNPHLAT